MSIQFDCPHCGQHFKITDDWAGKHVKCKACGRPMTVPLLPATGLNLNDLAPLAEGPTVQPRRMGVPLPPPIPLTRPRASRSTHPYLLLIVLGIVFFCIVFGILGFAVLIMSRDAVTEWLGHSTSAIGSTDAASTTPVALDRTIPPTAQPHRLSLVELLTGEPGENQDLIELTDFEVVPDSLTLTTQWDRITGAWVLLRPTPQSVQGATPGQRHALEFGDKPVVVLRMDGFATRRQIDAFLASPRVIGCLAGQGDPLIEDAAKHPQLRDDLFELTMMNLWVIDLDKMPLPGAKPWWPSEIQKRNAEYQAKGKAELARQQQAAEAARRQAQAEAQIKARQAEQRRIEQMKIQRQAEIVQRAQRLRDQEEFEKSDRQKRKDGLLRYEAQQLSRYPALDTTGVPTWTCPPDMTARLGEPVVLAGVVLAAPKDMTLMNYQLDRAIWSGGPTDAQMRISIYTSEDHSPPTWPDFSYPPAHVVQPSRAVVNQLPMARRQQNITRDGKPWIRLEYVGRSGFRRLQWEALFPDQPGLLELMDAAARTQHASTMDQLDIVPDLVAAFHNQTRMKPPVVPTSDSPAVAVWTPDPAVMDQLGDYVKVADLYEFRPPKQIKVLAIRDTELVCMGPDDKASVRIYINIRPGLSTVAPPIYPTIDPLHADTEQHGRIGDLPFAAANITNSGWWTMQLQAYDADRLIDIQIMTTEPQMSAVLLSSVKTFRIAR